MPKKFIKRFLPNNETIREQKSLKFLGRLLFNANLWHLNRNSVANAFSVGLFAAFIPTPFQMAIAAFGAIMFRCNLPISVALVWLTNPVTMPPIFYFCYRLGLIILDQPPQKFYFELSAEWITHHLATIWQPFLLGCFVTGAALAILSNVIIRLIWRYSVIRNWLERKRKRLLNKK